MLDFRQLPHQIQLNDPLAWDALHPGQFVVFLSDPRTELTWAPEGTIPVFDSLSDAETYAEQSVNRIPSICAAIYDHHGRSADPLRRIYHPSIRGRYDPERSARRNAWAGGGILGAFTIWAVVAAYGNSDHFLWFYILGLKLFTVGTVLFVRGIVYFLGRER